MFPVPGLVDHYLPEAVYYRLLNELAALPVHGNQCSSFCPRTWAVEFLAFAGVWPDAVMPERECEGA